MNDFMMYDVSAFFIFMTLIISNISKHRMKGRTNSLYLMVLVVSCITIVFRIIYQILLRRCEYSNNIEIVIRTFVYLSLIGRSLVYSVGLSFVFSSIGILPVFVRNDTLKLFLFILFLVPILYILMDCIKHIIFDITRNMEIVFLPPMIVLNISILTLLFFGFVMMLIYQRVLDKIHVAYGLALFPVNTLLFILQTIYPQVQIEMFVIAMTCYLAFATIQRPELLINTETLAQSSIAFENELKKSMSIAVPVKFVFIKITNYKNINMYVGNDKFIELLKQITIFLHDLSKKQKLGSNVYYLNDYVYALPTEGQTELMVDAILRDLQTYFSQDFILDGVRINLETRICAVRVPEDIDNFEHLLYISKQFYKIIEPNGKPQWYKDYVSDRNFIVRKNLDSILERAIQNRSFDVYYQPIYNIKRKCFTCAEALVRLNDPDYGNISPALFIPYAEKTNKIHIIGDFVLEKVCKFIGSEEYKALGLDYIEINMSVAQCFETDLVSKMRTWMEKYSVEPMQIRLEITENAATFNPQIVEKNMNILHKMGVSFALDDYGTGFSNIKKMISLPFDVVKVNKTFVDEIENPNTETLVKDTIHMLKSLGKEVLIEGIETKDRAELFTNYDYDKKLGCDYLQGFYFSKPLPKTEFVKFLTM